MRLFPTPGSFSLAPLQLSIEKQLIDLVWKFLLIQLNKEVLWEMSLHTQRLGPLAQNKLSPNPRNNLCIKFFANMNILKNIYSFDLFYLFACLECRNKNK